jgi:tetratricopeptide (TPR) repeat protein
MQILLELGDAQCRLGDLARSKETCLRAVALARKTGAAVELARAALGFCGEFVLYIVYDDARACLLEEALAALGDAEPALRARVLARLAREFRYTIQIERGRAHYDEAVRVARRSGDRATLGATLAEWYIGATAAGRPIEELAAASAEISQLANEIGAPDLLAWAHLCRINALTEQGDMRALELELEAYSALARRIRHRDHAWIAATIQTALELMRGRFDEAERLANEALALGQHAPRATVFGNYGLQLFLLRREQGRLAELEPFLVRRRPSDAIFAVVFPALLSLFYAELGRAADARGEFELLAANDFADLPQTSVWPVCIGSLAEVCCFLGDSSRADTLYRLLLPYSGRNVTRGQAFAPLYSADHYLGLLAATISKWDEAAGHFEAALAIHARMGARPLLARAQLDYARTLFRLGSPARARGRSLLEQAIATARKLGMASLLEKAEALDARPSRARRSRRRG